MKDKTGKALEYIHKIMDQITLYQNMMGVISWDMETVCPPEGRVREGEELTFLSSKIFALTRKDKYINSLLYLNKHKEEIGLYDQILVKHLYRDYIDSKNIDPVFQEQYMSNFSKAYDVWIKAKEKNDYALFEKQLARNVEFKRKWVLKRDDATPDNVYDILIDGVMPGYTSKELDKYFEDIKNGVVPLLKKVHESKTVIRDDFLFREVPVEKQKEFSTWLMGVLGFDFRCGALGETEHPFTTELNKKDERVATHYFKDNFTSNLYSIMHETGHALFGQNTPDIIKKNGLNGFQTLDMDESVSRFYENVIGKSRGFIAFVFPKLKEFFAPVLDDVTEDEFYKAVNKVFRQPLRTESDELSYSLHIVIRYEIEKGLFDKTLSTKGLRDIWNKKYKDYLDIDVQDDKSGILQDVHWVDSFAYFPVYAMGNGYNASYGKCMDRSFKKYGGLNQVLKEGRLDLVKNWMKRRVFKNACVLDPKDWIVSITHKELNAKDFVSYLWKKYEEIYNF